MLRGEHSALGVAYLLLLMKLHFLLVMLLTEGSIFQIANQMRTQTVAYYTKSETKIQYGAHLNNSETDPDSSLDLPMTP